MLQANFISPASYVGIELRWQSFLSQIYAAIPYNIQGNTE